MVKSNAPIAEETAAEHVNNARQILQLAKDAAEFSNGAVLLTSDDFRALERRLRFAVELLDKRMLA